MSSFTSRLESLAGRFRLADAAQLHAAGEALLSDAQAAARLRAYQNDPAVAALRVERTRDVLDRFGWVAIVLGLAFTTVNVALFVGGVIGWFVEPMIMGLLLVLLRGEQVAARYQQPSGTWVVGTRRGALVATYVMNTWTSWVALDPKQILIHSLPPIMVFCAAEALAQQRATLTAVASRIGTPWWGDVTPRAPGVTSVPRNASPAVVREPTTVELPVPARIPESERNHSGGPERAQERTEEPGVPEIGANGRRPRGSVKEALTRAFAELAMHTEWREIRPVDVDDKAGLPRGTAKRTINELRAAYVRAEIILEEVSPGGQSDEVDAVR